MKSHGGQLFCIHCKTIVGSGKSHVAQHIKSKKHAERKTTDKTAGDIEKETLIASFKEVEDLNRALASAEVRQEAHLFRTSIVKALVTCGIPLDKLRKEMPLRGKIEQYTNLTLTDPSNLGRD